MTARAGDLVTLVGGAFEKGLTESAWAALHLSSPPPKPAGADCLKGLLLSVRMGVRGGERDCLLCCPSLR